MTESNKLIVATAVIFVRLIITVSRAEGAHIALFEMAPSATLPYIVLLVLLALCLQAQPASEGGILSATAWTLSREAIFAACHVYVIRKNRILVGFPAVCLAAQPPTQSCSNFP